MLLEDSWVYYVNDNAVPPTKFYISTHLSPDQHEIIGAIIGKYDDLVFATQSQGSHEVVTWRAQY